MALLLSGSAVHIFKGIFIDPCRICTKSAQKKKKRKKGKKEKKRKKEKEKRSKKSKRYQITNFNIYSSKMLHSTFRSKIFLMSKEAHKTHFRSSQFLAAKGVFFCFGSRSLKNPVIGTKIPSVEDLSNRAVTKCIQKHNVSNTG